MLTGSLKSQYDKLLPQKQQDSIFRKRDSIEFAKKSVEFKLEEKKAALKNDSTKTN